MQEEDCRRSARAALMQREQHAEAMEKAEKLEAEAATYKSAVVSEPTVGDKAKPEEEILRKETPSKRWYKSENGQRAVEKVVGDLAEPLPDLLSSLVRLNRQMEDQAELMGQMRNYVQFWAGYDKFALAPSTSKKVWGSKGRLERMRALSSIMKELTQRLDIYIDVTTPDEDMEYPEE